MTLSRGEQKALLANAAKLQEQLAAVTAERDELRAALAAGVGVPPDKDQGCAPAKERQDARRSVWTYKACDDQNFPCEHCVDIKINRAGFALFPGEFTGADIRDFPLPGISDEYDLFLQGDGLDTHVAADTVIDICGGEQFYTAPRTINAG